MFSPQVLTSNCRPQNSDEIQSAYQYHCNVSTASIPRAQPLYATNGNHCSTTACQGGGAATRLTADQLHPGSSPGLGLVIAAIAEGIHLDPCRTQQLSPLTYGAVLRYASPREPLFAAITSFTMNNAASASIHPLLRNPHSILSGALFPRYATILRHRVFNHLQFWLCRNPACAPLLSGCKFL